MLTRRSFLRITGASTIGLFVATRAGWAPRAVAQIPGGSLDPAAIGKFATPLLIPPVMPRAGTINQRGGKPVDYYEISVRQFEQQILPAGMPTTPVWGYGAVKSASKRGLLLHHAPSLTIETTWKRPVRIKWINDLVDSEGNFRPHLLPVDPTLHWANPPGGEAGRDMRPMFDSTPSRYLGPVPIVPHLHGAAGVGDESDGYAEAWYLAGRDRHPGRLCDTGHVVRLLRRQGQGEVRCDVGPGLCDLPLPERPARVDAVVPRSHAGHDPPERVRGTGRLLPRSRWSDGEKAVLDSRTGTTAVLPGPAPNEGDAFPSNKTYYEIPIAIQDRSFNTDGSLFYPDTRAFFDGIAGPYIPESDVSPIWNPEFFGNTIMVNGNTWPLHTVEQRRYRLRFLNGCQSRFLILDFSGIPGVEVWQIGNEGGFLAAPVNLTADHRQSPADGAGGAGGPHRRLHSGRRPVTMCFATSVPTSRSAVELLAWTSIRPTRRAPAKSCASTWFRRLQLTRRRQPSFLKLPSLTGSPAARPDASPA